MFPKVVYIFTKNNLLPYYVSGGYVENGFQMFVTIIPVPVIHEHRDPTVQVT